MTDTLERLREALGGRYRIERRLGAGGMAVVYLAEDLKHHRHVALKVLRPELAAVIGPERFLREIQLTAGLRHPHVLPLFDSGEVDGQLYYVMPFVEGESLRDRLERAPRMPLNEALAIAGDVAAALTFAHERGIVHRDIKPDNILLEDGEGLVADFGIALAVAGSDATRLTGTGLAIGTPAYMSPEQVTGEPTVDGRSDVYSLACVLFEMVTGRPPFQGPTAQAVLSQSMATPAPSARALRSDLPVEIENALTKALAKNPADRFATPREFLEACAPPPPRRVPRRWAVLGGAAVLAVAVGISLTLWRNVRVANARAGLVTIAQLADQRRYLEAYDLAVAAEQWIPGDSALARLMAVVSDLLSIETIPSGARVYAQRVPNQDDAPADSFALGTTPLVDYRLPRTDHRVTIRLAGHAPLERIVSSAVRRGTQLWESARTVQLDLTLWPADSVPPGTVPIPGGAYAIRNPDLPVGLETDLQPFLLDRFEVTNDAYAEFLRSGGADAPALRAYVDRTGLPGPRDWVNQMPPPGTERHPVTGVSWHEAAAFCAAAGKRLPTVYEWEKAARDGMASVLGVLMPWGFQVTAGDAAARRANFNSSGTMPVDAHPFGIGPYGAHGMAGNAKEWLANPAGEGYAVTGGSWQDPAYVFGELGALPADAASTALGFRCARTMGTGRGDQGSHRIETDPTPPTYRPVDAATFRTLLSHYRYDPQPANPRGVERTTTPDWTRERLWIDGLRSDSILAYLYLPKRAAPPYQTLIYVPSSAAFFYDPVWRSVEHELAGLIKAGRAVLTVVLQGMLERPFPPGFTPPPPASVQFRDLMVRHATELRLGMDWLEARDEIDMTRLAYIGLSLGAGSRLPFAAVDERFRSVILLGAGIDERLHPTLPEASNINFAPYIVPPKLMLNGRQDEEHPWATRALPLWNLLREPKELVLVEGAGHHPPAKDRIPVVNAFLDRTLGPVTPLAPATSPP